METFSEKIIGRIEKEKLAPKARWRFLLKDYALWSLVVASALVGAFAVMMLLVMTHVEDWDVVPYLHRTTIGHALVSVSYLWIAVLAVLFVIVRLNFSYTRRGYRYPTYWIVVGSVVMSLLAGSGLYYGGAGAGWDDYLANKVPLYDRVVYTKNDIWIYPELGLLGGNIEAFQDGKSFTMTDLKGDSWQVKLAADTVWENGQLEATGTKVKLIGIKDGEGMFSAKLVRAW
jgi:hypothetical protein